MDSGVVRSEADARAEMDVWVTEASTARQDRYQHNQCQETSTPAGRLCAWHCSLRDRGWIAGNLRTDRHAVNGNVPSTQM
jgi:hypothetical protein